MTLRVVCDTMVFYQWVTIRRERLHGLHTAVSDGRATLCLSTDLLAEVRRLLARASIRIKAPNLTDERVTLFLDALLANADYTSDPPKVFTIPQHPKDDHVYNLAIAAKVDRIVTWENKMLKLEDADSVPGKRLRSLAPTLHVVTPAAVMAELESES